MGNSGNKTPRSATTGGDANQTAAQGNHEGHNPLSEVLGALGDTPGKRETQQELDPTPSTGCLSRDEPIGETSNKRNGQIPPIMGTPLGEDNWMPLP
jgi:hypothetical protein